MFNLSSSNSLVVFPRLLRVLILGAIVAALPVGSALAATITVSNESQLLNAVSNLNAGDIIEMQDGTYQNVDVVINASGTANNRIIIRAVNPGNVIFSGTSKVTINGNRVTVRDIYFRNGASNYSGAIFNVRGDHVRITNNAFHDYGTASSYVGAQTTVNGSGNTIDVAQYLRVDHNSFTDKRGTGQYIDLDTSRNSGDTPVVQLPLYARIDHNYFSGPRKGGNSGGGIRIGFRASDNGRSIIDHNVFENQNAESEVITSKSGENAFLFNTLINNQGTLNFRGGQDQVAIGNYFLGANTDKTNGGMYIWSSNHLVAGNYFEPLRGHNRITYAALHLNPGPPPGTPNNGHPIAQDTTVANNVFAVRQDYAVSFDSLYPWRLNYAANLGVPGQVVLADDIRFKNNVFLGDSQSYPDSGFFHDESPPDPTNLSFQNNYAVGAPVGVNYATIASASDPGLVRGADGILRLPSTAAMAQNRVTLDASDIPNIPGLDTIDYEGSVDFLTLANSSIGPAFSGTVPHERRVLSFDDPEVGPDWLTENPSAFATTGHQLFPIVHNNRIAVRMGYSVTWTDEFSRNDMDTSVWTVTDQNTPIFSTEQNINYQRQSSQISIEKDEVIFTAERTTQNGQPLIKVGEIRSQRTFGRGFLDLKFGAMPTTDTGMNVRVALIGDTSSIKVLSNSGADASTRRYTITVQGNGTTASQVINQNLGSQLGIEVTSSAYKFYGASNKEVWSYSGAAHTNEPRQLRISTEPTTTVGNASTSSEFPLETPLKNVSFHETRVQNAALPVADFVPSATLVNVGDTVYFTDASSGPHLKSRYWNFGNGETSHQVSPSVSYSSAGDYRVRLSTFSTVGIDFKDTTVTVVDSGAPPPPPPPPTNLALAGTATQSSLAHGGVPERAIDNNTNGVWGQGSVTHTAQGNENYWTLDLGSVQNIDNITLWNRTDSCCSSRLSDFHVFVSDVPFTGTSVASSVGQSGVFDYFHSGAASASTDVTVNRTGRYVRVQLTATGSTGSPLSLAEVQVFGTSGSEPPPPPPPPPTNLALAGTATQSSLDWGGVPERGIDNNTNGVYGQGSVTHTARGSENYWTLDLGSVKNIETISVWNRTDSCCSSRLSNFHVFVSDVPFTGTTVAASVGQSGVFNSYHSGAASATTVVAVNRTGRYVRVQLTETGSNGNALSLAEVQVMGN